MIDITTRPCFVESVQRLLDIVSKIPSNKPLSRERNSKYSGNKKEIREDYILSDSNSNKDNFFCKKISYANKKKKIIYIANAIIINLIHELQAIIFSISMTKIQLQPHHGTSNCRAKRNETKF